MAVLELEKRLQGACKNDVKNKNRFLPSASIVARRVNPHTIVFLLAFKQIVYILLLVSLIIIHNCRIEFLTKSL